MIADVLLRVDAGPAVGLGHLQRCLALAAAFADAGCRVTFLVNDDPLVTARVASAGWTVERVTSGASWNSEDASAVIDRAVSGAIIVVDSDLEPPAYVRRLREAGLFVCTVEDRLVDDVHAQVLLNGDAHAEHLGYRINDNTTWLLGPEYAPLPPPYWEPVVAAARVPPAALLVTLGGADPAGLMPALLDEAVRLPESLRLEIVIGPFMEPAAIDAAAARLGRRATVHRAPSGMFPLIAGCDLAITAAGQTLYELAALGRPAVAIQVADNQAPQLAAFVGHGVTLSAGEASAPGVAARVVTMAAELAANAPRLRAQAAAGRAFIDGQGARRAARAVLARAAQTFGMLGVT